MHRYLNQVNPVKYPSSVLQWYPVRVGDITSKYMALRTVIGKYLPLPSTPVPANNTRKAYGTVQLSFVSPVRVRISRNDVRSNRNNRSSVTSKPIHRCAKPQCTRSDSKNLDKSGRCFVGTSEHICVVSSIESSLHCLFDHPAGSRSTRKSTWSEWSTRSR